MSSGSEWRPRHNPYLIALAVMLATFMEVLDTSIANVAVPYIAGGLSATSDEATWVLTSYLIANAIILPATAWLGSVFGRKRFLLVCIVIFTCASALCGMAGNLGFLVAARVLQGAGGGALQPVSQAVLLESFPPEKRNLAMATFAMGVVVAPIVGPIVGGWITDQYSWRWIFYINLPIGVAAVLLASVFIEDPPYLKRVSFSSIDSIGFGLMAVWLATLQFVLDKGQEDDWFSSRVIFWCAVISGICFAGFIVRELQTRAPLVDLCVLKNRNFSIGITLIAVVGIVLYGTTAMLPLLMQNLLGYTAYNSGLALAPRGVGAFLTTIVVGRVAGKYVSNRIVISTGVLILAAASFALGGIDLGVPMSWLAWLSVVNGIGVSMMFVPLATSTMGRLSQQEMSNATGIFNLMRNLGGSVGISALTTLIARTTQKHQALMVRAVTPTNPIYRQHFAYLKEVLMRHGDPILAARQAEAVIASELGRQAAVTAYLNSFRLLALLCVMVLPLVVLMRKARGGKPVMAH